MRGTFSLPGTERQYERSLPFNLLHVDLVLSVSFQERMVTGHATWTFERTAPRPEKLVLDAVALDVKKVLIQGRSGWKKAPFSYDCERLEIDVGKAKSGRVRIDYAARPERGLYFLSPDEHYPDRPTQLWSQCQDEDARHWFPCHDKPHVKCTARFEITAPQRFSVLCNGTLSSEKKNGKQRTKTTTYEMAQRMPSYLFTLVVGEFDTIEDRPAKLASGRSIPVTYWVPKGRKADGRRGFARTPDMIELFSELSGVEYPYERYTQVVVSEFIFGGMENTTATTMYEHVLLDERAAIDIDSYDLVAHELAHQWFGDWVTCKDWAHAWLNEGFATYFEHIEREHRENRDEYLLGVERDLNTYLGEAASRYSRPIVCRDYEEPIDLFDRHLYEKGGLVLHCLRATLGDENFWAGVREYLSAHAQSSVTTDNLRAALERHSGRSLDRFFDEWVYRAGHANVRAKVSWASGQLTVTFEQLSKHHYELDFEVEVVDSKGKAHRLHRTSGDKHAAVSLHLDARPKHVVVDPELRLLGRVSIEAPTDMLKDQLLRATSPRGKRQAARLLAKKNDFSVVSTLQTALSRKNESWTVRAAAARALGELRNEDAFEALAKYGNEKHAKVRHAVIVALGKFRTRASFELLSSLLKKEKSYLATAAAARSLGQTRRGEAARLLQRQLRQASWGDVVAAAAADGIAALRRDDGAGILMKHTEYGQPTRLRRTAVRALARLSDDKKTRQHLEDLLDDPHPHVRLDVASALGQLEQKEARAALERHLGREKDPRVIRRVREILRDLGQQETHRDLKDKVSQLERQLNEVLGRVNALEAKHGGKKK